MSENPPRRWFRFSLRTLLVVVTILCCYLGWESSIVRQRRLLIDELRSQPGVILSRVKDYPDRHPPGLAKNRIAKVPTIRAWLGDEPVQGIWYTRGVHRLSSARRARIAALFPEAEISEVELLYEPCHPGCFPRGTVVETPSGPRLIETIEPGDRLLAYQHGQSAIATVQSVFVTSNRLWEITTRAGVLTTTEIQPLCRSLDRAVPAGELEPGDTILHYRDGQIGAAEVLSVAPSGRTERVYNLVLGQSELFIAGGFLARSKPPAADTAQAQSMSRTH